MPETERVRINDRRVTHELIEGEVIAINLETGCYYSLAGVAADCWRLLGETGSVTAVVTRIGRRYGVDPQRAQRDVTGFVAELEQEGLVVREAAAAAAAPDAGEPERATDPYAPPRLEKYEDMQDLLVLDPIHDVDETGWPVRKPRDVA